MNNAPRSNGIHPQGRETDFQSIADMISSFNKKEGTNVVFTEEFYSLLLEHNVKFSSTIGETFVQGFFKSENGESLTATLDQVIASMNGSLDLKKNRRIGSGKKFTPIRSKEHGFWTEEQRQADLKQQEEQAKKHSVHISTQKGIIIEVFDEGRNTGTIEIG